MLVEMQSSRLTQLALVLIGLALGLSVGRAPTAVAQQAGGGQMFAVTAPGNNPGQNTLFVIDPQAARLAVYEYKSHGTLELRAVRNMDGELKLDEWPDPKFHRQIPPVKPK
jgi:hypothetical protein